MIENIELLQFIYENAEMGKYTTTLLLNILKEKENKIKGLLQTEIKEYEKHMMYALKILKKYKEKAQGTSQMSKISSKIGINLETIKDNSDSALAQMIVQGLTMGSTSLTSKINKYEGVADRKILKIAKDYLKYLKVEIDRLSKYM